MRILVANIKGGVGKTVPVSLNLALLYKFNVLTNDNHSLITQVLGKNGLILEGDQAIPPTPEDFNVIYDMGGKVDARLIDGAKKADVILVPFIMDTFFDTQATISTIAALEEYNTNIIVIANKTENGDYSRVRKEIRKHFQYPVMELKKSTAYKNAVHKRIPITQLIKETKNPFMKKNYQTPLKQTRRIMQEILRIVESSKAAA